MDAILDMYFKDKNRIKEKYRFLINEYLEEIKNNADLKVVVRSVFSDNDKFIVSIELAKVIDYDHSIYITKRLDEVESLDAAQTLQKIIIANLNMVS